MKHALYFLLPASLALGLTDAAAGDVKLTNNSWSSICVVEVTSGLNAPQQGQAESFRNVGKGWSITRSERLCYRRSGDPANCQSAVTDWSCATQAISGTNQFDLR